MYLIAKVRRDKCKQVSISEVCKWYLYIWIYLQYSATTLKILEKRSRTLSVEIFFLLYSVEGHKIFRRQCAWTEFQNFESRDVNKRYGHFFVVSE